MSRLELIKPWLATFSFAAFAFIVGKILQKRERRTLADKEKP